MIKLKINLSATGEESSTHAECTYILRNRTGRQENHSVDIGKDGREILKQIS